MSGLVQNRWVTKKTGRITIPFVYLLVTFLNPLSHTCYLGHRSAENSETHGDWDCCKPKHNCFSEEIACLTKTVPPSSNCLACNYVLVAKSGELYSETGQISVTIELSQVPSATQIVVQNESFRLALPRAPPSNIS